MMRRAPAGLIAVLLILGLGRAEAASKRVGVPKFEGAQEALVRKKVMQVLKAHGYELVRSRDMQAAASSAGASLDSSDGLQTTAKELALSAIVTGSVTGKRAKLVVHDGSDGSALGDASFAGANPRKLAADVGATFWRKLGGDVGRGHAPAGAKKNQKASTPEAGEDAAEEGGEPAGAGAAAESESKPAAEAEATPSRDEHKKKPKMEGEAAPEQKSAPSAPSGLAWLDLSVGGGGLHRTLAYNQDVSANRLLPYSLGFGPVAQVKAVLYPFDPWVGGALGNWGFEASFLQGFSISSKLSSGGSYSNTVHDYAGGTRYRFPFSGVNDAYISATFGEDAFTYSGTNRGALLIPDTIYRYVRGGAGLQMQLVPQFGFAITAGYRYILNKAGPQISQSFFPNLAVAGADVGATVTYAINQTYALRGGVDYRRYWFSMHSKTGDMFVTGGAVDQSVVLTASLVLTLGATPAAETGEAEAAPAPAKKSGKAHPAHGDEGGDSGGGGDEGGGGAKSGGGDE